MRSKLRSGGHIANKNSPRFAAGAACVDAHPAGHAGPLRFPVLLFTGGDFRAWARFQESHTHPHTGGESLHASDMPRYRLCGVRCDVAESNRVPSPGSVGHPSVTSHRSSSRNVGDLCLRTAQGRNVRGLHCIGGPFRLCRYYYNTIDFAHVSMISTVKKFHELLCKTVKIAERCIRPYLCQLTKALRNGSGDRPRV